MTVVPLRLKLAKRGTGGGFTVSYCSISVKVQNVGFAKERSFAVLLRLTRRRQECPGALW